MKVYYMNGAGNDFMVMDARDKNYSFAELETLTKEYCPMTGADGFMAIDYSEKADFKLHFYNSDGNWNQVFESLYYTELKDDFKKSIFNCSAVTKNCL